MLGALVVIVVGILVMTICGVKQDSPALVGLVTGVSSLAGGIAGFAQKGAPPQQAPPVFPPAVPDLPPDPPRFPKPTETRV